MSVIAFPNIAPRGPGARIDWELRSNTARFVSPLTGSTRTLERGGAHWAATLRYENLNGAEAAQFRAFLSSFRGQAQRAYMPAFGYTQRGSFPATELLTNSDFSNGTTGWTASGSPVAVLTAADGRLRITQAGATANAQALQSALSVTQYAPHINRGVFLQGRGSNHSYLTQMYDGSVQINSSSIAGGMSHVVQVPNSTSLLAAFINNTIAVGLAGDYFEIAQPSVSRCALVDSGPNSLLRSDEFNNASWDKSECTIATDVTAPDGTATADAIVESTNNAAHYVQQTYTVPSAQADFCVAVAVNPNGRNFVWLRLQTAGGNVDQFFNLATGAVASGSTTGTWANRRAFIVPMGTYYYCCVVGRKANSDTALSVLIGSAAADGVTNYTGNGSSGVILWRATSVASSVPTRLVQTTSAATSGTSQTGGALYLKGLPASTNGLLLADDLAEIITPSGSQFVRALNSLNSDAAGLGYFQFEPPLRESPADNAAVIVGTPLMRAMLVERTVQWSQRHAGFVDLEFAVVEDMTA